MSGGGKRSREAVMKIVIINTHYVETDAISFKSLVQKLTGKNSTIAAAKELESQNLRKIMEEARSAGSGVKISIGNNNNKKPVLERDLSFKEFEILLRDMPMPMPLQMDELWDDYI